MLRPTPALTEPHRRCLRRFARWTAAAESSPPDVRAAIRSPACRVAAGGMSTADEDAALDTLDGLLLGDTR